MTIAIRDIDPEDVFRLVVLKKTLGEEFKRVAFVIKYAGLLDRRTIDHFLNGGRELLRHLESLAQVLKTKWLKGIVSEIACYLKKAISYGRIAKWIKVFFVDKVIYYAGKALALSSAFINVISVLFG